MQFTLRGLFVGIVMIGLALALYLSFDHRSGEGLTSNGSIGGNLELANGLLSEIYSVRLDFCDDYNFTVKIDRTLKLMQNGKVIEEYLFPLSDDAWQRNSKQCEGIHAIASSFGPNPVVETNLPKHLRNAFRRKVGNFDECRQLWDYLNRHGSDISTPLITANEQITLKEVKLQIEELLRIKQEGPNSPVLVDY